MGEVFLGCLPMQLLLDKIDYKSTKGTFTTGSPWIREQPAQGQLFFLIHCHVYRENLKFGLRLPKCPRAFTPCVTEQLHLTKECKSL